jgi:crotonobetainyl-CoA:carnitine CoA-transferase CaiB-like acyl-CoA transferase
VVWDKLSGLYSCGGGCGDGAPGWVRVHANFAHHRDGVLALLGLPVGPDTERAAVAAALQNWSALDFEDAAAERGLVVAALRSPSEWAAHAQAAAVAAQPLLAIERSGDAPPLLWPAAATAAPDGLRSLNGLPALAGLRVLELTRILAGPVAGRTLAVHGADVLLINAPHLPNIEALAETSRGKRSGLLDLRQPDDCATLRGLIKSCDVFLHGYRPGALAARGFGPAELEKLRPGIVSVSLSAYGTQGPWGQRRGFDSLVQSATGFNLAEAAAMGSSEPRALPLQALDYGAGYLLAFGAMAALLHQRQRGGSWRVRLSLAGVGQWLTRIGRIADPARAPALDFDSVMEERDSGFGRLRSVPHAGRVDGQRLNWRRSAMPPGSHPAAWPLPD